MSKNSILLDFLREKEEQKQALIIKMFLEEDPEEVFKREDAWIGVNDYQKIIIALATALQAKNKGL